MATKTRRDFLRALRLITNPARLDLATGVTNSPIITVEVELDTSGSIDPKTAKIALEIFKVSISNGAETLTSMGTADAIPCSKSGGRIHTAAFAAFAHGLSAGGGAVFRIVARLAVDITKDDKVTLSTTKVRAVARNVEINRAAA